MMPAKIDFSTLVGKKYHRLTIIKEGEKYFTAGGNPKTMAVCECECGGINSHSLAEIRSGRIKSCGCLNSEITSKRAVERNRTHGKTKNP